MKSTITVNGKTRLGELVTYFPTITTRLNELHIDYCSKEIGRLKRPLKKRILILVLLRKFKTPIVII